MPQSLGAPPTLRVLIGPCRADLPLSAIRRNEEVFPLQRMGHGRVRALLCGSEGVPRLNEEERQEEAFRFAPKIDCAKPPTSPRF